MEAKFVACAFAVQKVIWLKKFFEHLDTTKNSQGPMTLYYDSQEAIAYTKDPKYQIKNKHIDIKYNFLIDMVASGEITLQYIPTRSMITVHFTKAISRDLFEKHVMALGLRRI
ncbi:hypothetical protein A4A49_60271 [Nicotiana attenuata]|uniref:Retrovirus-related pol polyprotein from transposon tnt 1-94 n=1 Tax=Nicotiana attenuata TaxID=49451 RepID=A0A314KS84_NICAT|nr:hypothetical protein A4A49_60271 [Nicotiana attenuata]